MKKLLLFGAFMLAHNLLFAQPWMPANTSGPIKYAEALSRYHAYSAKINEEVDVPVQHGREEQEDKNHLFQVWNYYWKMHLDQDGYMVPPVRNLREWQKSVETKSSQRAARTTSVIPSDWVFQGPDACAHGYSGLGRINVVTFDPVDSNTFYVGSAAGSTWKTTDGGLTWSSLYDNLPTLGVSDIKVNPLNRNEIFVATGDGDAGDSYSSGVIVSHDGGATWLTTGLTWLPTDYYNARSLLINPQDTSTMLLASNAGIFKTYNSGLTWTNVYTGNFKQILYKPGDTTTVYGTMYIDTTAQIMRSTDGGNTWNFVTVFPTAQRINIAVCPAMPNIVKAVVSNQASGLQGIYSSSDNGATFTPTYVEDTSCAYNLLGYDRGLPTSNCGGQGWYDLCIAIDPANSEQVMVGGVNTYYSSDGGTSWHIANQWYGSGSVSVVHADKHCLAYNPLSGGLFETCDGGIYKNYGPLTEPWADLTDGITITEFYRNAVNNQVTFCIGGCQDNGTKMIDGGVATDLTGGDGMQPLINYGDPADIWYCAYQNGSIDMTRNAGANYHSITDTLHSSGGWISPYVIHPTDTATLLLAYDQVFVSHNNGLSWTAASPVFDSSANMNTLAIAPSNPSYLFATYYNYNVWKPVIVYTTNSGSTWDTITPPTSSYISDLVIDPTNENRLWITVSAYGVAKVWQYNLLTHSWTDDSYGLPDVPVQCMIVDTSSRTQYIGTDDAVYYKDTMMFDWVLYNTNLPTVQVDDLHINYTTNELWAATFGRGMWKSVKADHTTAASVPLVSKENDINVFPNPANMELTVSATENINTITIFNLIGQTLYTRDYNSKQVRVNIAFLPDGVYFVKVNGSETKKFVKEL